jgi:hypothetical protein
LKKTTYNSPENFQEDPEWSKQMKKNEQFANAGLKFAKNGDNLEALIKVENANSSLHCLLKLTAGDFN